MFHRVGDRWVHSLSFGDGPGTFVGVAGSFANWEIWAPLFERMSPRWRTVGFDQDGVGQTKVPLDQITREQQLETLFSVLDAQDVERCVIAGDSNNTTLAIQAVLAAPERFQGLVVVNGRAWDFESPDVHRFVAGLHDHFEATIEFFVKVVFPEPDSEHLQAWLHDIIRRTGPEATARIIESYFGIDLRDRLGEVAVPAMVIHGDQDALSPTANDDARELADRLGGELRVLEGAGHLPLLSRPDEVASHVDEFMRRCCGAG